MLNFKTFKTNNTVSGLLLQVLLASGIPHPAPCSLYGVRELAFLAHPGLVFLYGAVHPADALAHPGAVLSYDVVHPADVLVHLVPVSSYNVADPAGALAH